MYKQVGGTNKTLLKTTRARRAKMPINVNSGAVFRQFFPGFSPSTPWQNSCEDARGRALVLMANSGTEWLGMQTIREEMLDR